MSGAKDHAGADVALIVSNGLSSTAVERHGLPLLQALVNGYRARNIRIALVCLVANGRVALKDVRKRMSQY